MNDYGGLGILLEEREPMHDPRKDEVTSALHGSSDGAFVEQPERQIDMISHHEGDQVHTEFEPAHYAKSEAPSQNEHHLLHDQLDTALVGPSCTPTTSNLLDRSSSIHEVSAVDTMHYYQSHPQHNDDSFTETQPSSAETEILLPPLPDVDSDNDNRSLSTSITTTVYSPQNEIANTRSSNDEILLHQSIFGISEMKYELDSPSLNLDSIHMFPSLSTSNATNNTQTTIHSPSSSHTSTFGSPSLSASTTNATGNLRTNSVTSSSFPNLANLFNVANNSTGSAASTNNSSPLRRLKSLKNGIRKLSLGAVPTTGSVSTPGINSVSPANSTISSSSNGVLRPSLNPIQTDVRSEPPINRHSHNSSRSSNSSTGSNVSSGNMMNNITATLNSALNTATLSTITPTISKSSRRRTHSTLTPLTPPLMSPIITLSENLNSSKKTLVDIEQSYFECLNMKLATGLVSPTSEKTGNSSSSSDSIYSSNQSGRSRVSSITEITSSAELINYSTFLNHQKKSFSDAFESTKVHLTQSGWCSSHDLNNLQLQQDTQMSQIDTKLLQIEEKLNSDYGISLLSNIVPQYTNGGGATLKRLRGLTNDDKVLPVSPSLKVLESRCFSFADV